MLYIFIYAYVCRDSTLNPKPSSRCELPYGGSRQKGGAAAAPVQVKSGETPFCR